MSNLIHKKEHKFLTKLATCFSYGFSKSVTPGFCLQAFHKGNKVLDIQWGKTWEYYDVASLTKIMVTNSILFHAISEKKINWTQPINNFLPWILWNNPVRDLLRHRIGLKWWAPFYKQIDISKSLLFRRNVFMSLLKNEKLNKSPVSSYSDLDFMVLGLILEEIYNLPLEIIWLKIRDQWGIKTAAYHPNNIAPLPSSHYAPTEYCSWRKQMLRGQVHDENTWAIGGVAGHAGLFSTINDVGLWGLTIRNLYLNNNNIKNCISSKIIKQFLSRSTPKNEEDWAWGFMMPTIGTSSCGTYFSTNSIGHTGFTGTSFWWDPKKDWMIIILSNRIHPSRKNKDFLKLRPILHDLAYQSCFN